jgi:hypothetical protein
MRKLVFLAIGLIIAVGGQVNVQAVKLGAFFWAEDAVGNRDTVWLYIKDGATDGFDQELEENLYNVPPQGALDLRIIQRTDTNYYSEAEPGKLPGVYWLLGYFSEHHNGHPDGDDLAYGWLEPYSSNADLKINYIANIDPGPYNRGFAIYCHSIHYPIAIHLFYPGEVPDSMYSLNPVLRGTVHDVEGGAFSYYDAQFQAYDERPFIIDSGGSNELIILYEFCPVTSIRNDAELKILYPNPSNNYVILDDVSLGTHNLIDGNGSIIKEFNIDAIPYQFDVSKLPNGNYFITSQSNKYLFKFIKTGGVK